MIKKFSSHTHYNHFHQHFTLYKTHLCATESNNSKKIEKSLSREDGIKESNLSKTPGICTAANLLLIDNYLLFLYEELTQKRK